jgi:nucleoside-diphosphate-sugar epimerase
MYNLPDRNSSSDQNSPSLDMKQLQELIKRQSPRRPIFENIAVLGCGYVGRALADSWQEQGHFVTSTTTSKERISALSEILSKVVLAKGSDFSAMQSLLQGQDTLVVSIAPTGFQEADAATYEATYISTTQNLVKVLSQSPNVTQIIYLSSCSVYGDRQGEWVDETSPITPAEQRSRVIYDSEKIILQAANEQQKVCVLRLGGIYGPGRELVSMFGGLAGMTIPGKGDRFINWIHRDDIIGAIEFARLNELHGIYNLVDDSKLTVKEQVSRVCAQYDLPQAKWDSSQLSLQRKSFRVSNHKLKVAGYELIYPQLLV